MSKVIFGKKKIWIAVIVITILIAVIAFAILYEPMTSINHVDAFKDASTFEKLIGLCDSIVIAKYVGLREVGGGRFKPEYCVTKSFLGEGEGENLLVSGNEAEVGKEYYLFLEKESYAYIHYDYYKSFPVKISADEVSLATMFSDKLGKRSEGLGYDFDKARLDEYIEGVVAQLDEKKDEPSYVNETDMQTVLSVSDNVVKAVVLEEGEDDGAFNPTEVLVLKSYKGDVKAFKVMDVALPEGSVEVGKTYIFALDEYALDENCNMITTITSRHGIYSAMKAKTVKEYLAQ